MRSMMRWTAKLSSRWVSLGLRRARLRASRSRQRSMSLEEFVVNVGGALLGPVFLDELVERAFEDRVAGEHAGNLVPAFSVFGAGNVKDAGEGGVVFLVGLDAAVIDGELLEVGEDRERELGGPGVAAELEGRTDIVLDVHRGFLGFEKELARAADAEAVVRRFGARRL